MHTQIFSNFLHNFFFILNTTTKKKRIFLAHKFFFISNLPTNLTAWDFFSSFFIPKKLHKHTHTKEENFPQFFLHEKETRTSEKREKKAHNFILLILWWFEKEKWLRRALEWQQEKGKERKKFQIFFMLYKILFFMFVLGLKNFLKMEKNYFLEGMESFDNVRK